MLKLTILIINILLVAMLYAQYTPNDPEFGNQWGHVKVKAPEAWDISLGQREIIVGVIDTGVNWHHPDLQGKIWTNSAESGGVTGVDDDGNGYVDDVRGWDFYGNGTTGDADPNDEFTGGKNGHGSLVAGIIAANIDNGINIAGLCDNIKIMSLKITSASAKPYNGDDENLVNAINYAIDNGADIINASLVGWDYNESVLNALQNAYNAGILVVTSAGNKNKNNDNTSNYPSSYQVENIIPVLATNSDDTKRSHSNYGAVSVDLGAPGSGIFSTTKSPDNTTVTDDGTSFAAPYVAGALALLYSSASDELNAYRMSDPVGASMYFKDIILNSVDPIEALSGKCTSGGRLNIEEAMLLAHKKIIFANKRDGELTALGGTLSLFNNNTGFNVLNHSSSDEQNTNVIEGHFYDSRTDQKELSDGSDNLKHLKWNSEENEFRFYHKDILMNEFKTSEIAFFKE